MKFSISLRK